MTEYDYSPQAWERYIATQQRIARWVDGTLVQEPCNAFTPATPHVQALQLKKELKEEKHRRREERRAYYDDASDVSDEYDTRYARSSHTRHRKSHSTKEVPSSSSHRSPRKDRSRERERERRDKDKDRVRDGGSASARHYRPEKSEKPSKPKHREEPDFVWVDRDSPSPSSSSTRPRSSSQSTKPRPSHRSTRSYNAPQLTLDLPPFPSRPQDPYYYHNRNSGHSSQSSATTPNSGSTSHGKFPVGQVPPHSAPPLTGPGPVLGGGGGTPPKPTRAHTTPQYVYAGVDKNGYPMHRPVGPAPQPVLLPIRPTVSGSKSYGSHNMAYAPDPSKAPQLPYSAYQAPPKSQSLLKRMFGFKAKNTESSLSSSPQQPPPSQYYQPQPPSKEPNMFLGGGGSGKRMTRKRSVSF